MEDTSEDAALDDSLEGKHSASASPLPSTIKTSSSWYRSYSIKTNPAPDGALVTFVPLIIFKLRW